MDRTQSRQQYTHPKKQRFEKRRGKVKPLITRRLAGVGFSSADFFLPNLKSLPRAPRVLAKQTWEEGFYVVPQHLIWAVELMSNR